MSSSASRGRTSLSSGSLSQRAPEALLQRLDWTVLRRLDGLLQGEYRTLFFGHGLDLADLREYQPGDDVRYIDWNVTARMSTAYVRRYHEDREVTAQFICDLSPSVDFGTQRATKRLVVAEAVGVLARILSRGGNRVGAVVHDGVSTRTVPAATGRVQVLRVLEELARAPRLARAPTTALGDVLASAAAAFRRRALVFVVSDFWSAPGWERPLGVLAQRHDVIAVRVRDAREHELPDIGWVVFDDAETGEQHLVDTNDRGFRDRFRAAAERNEASLGEAFARSGVDTLVLDTGGDLVRSIAAFASLRRRRSRRRN